MPSHDVTRARRLRLIDAPSNLGLRPPTKGAEPGVSGMPRALRARGLLERLGAEDGGGVPAPAYDPRLDPGTGVRNGPALAAYARVVADRVGGVIEDGDLPVVVGGDCSILLGPALALRRRGRYGLAFVDGHADFRHPSGPDPVGAVAGEDFAVVTGRGAGALADIDGLRPYVRDEDAVAIGFDPADGDYAGFDRTAIARYDAKQVRTRGAAAIVDAALRRLETAPRAGFWLHFDCDVLHRRVMPAVDSPNPVGLELEEARDVLAGLLRSPALVGVDLTIFDPTLDPTGELAERLVGLVVDAFGTAGRGGA